ncbi:hypothetical protein MSAN_01216700 [Mycena sanguinolenta]|uniref:Restriction of telomere capping protein 4 C-terminal domain-containing protein n=1 Tax=Mycena sanguinolenta TaxID=230812 RepID=A0A8H6YIW7_9AGAR|nr:hypothetical protein MSAN_01216700 [Mycena sanguinolenta]
MKSRLVLLFLAKEICQALRSENKRRECLNEAIARGWVLDVDFAGLHDRVMEIQAHFLMLAFNSEELDDCPIWSLFLDLISYKVHSFSLSRIGTFSSAADRLLRCGYFRPKGHSIIVSAIRDSLDNSVNLTRLHTTIASLKDQPQEWERSRYNCLPSQDQFTHYVLAPFVAASLISKDLDVDFNAALKVMQESSDYGDLFNPFPLPVSYSSPSPPLSPLQPLTFASGPKLTTSELAQQPVLHTSHSKSTSPSPMPAKPFLEQIRAITTSKTIQEVRKSNLTTKTADSKFIKPPARPNKLPEQQVESPSGSNRHDAAAKPSKKSKPVKTTLNEFPPVQPVLGGKSSKTTKQVKDKESTSAPEHGYRTRSRR